MLPTTTVQLYSTDSYALTNKSAHQEKLIDKTSLHKKQAKINIEPPLKTKKVSFVKGKKNSQGMQLLSVLLLLKDNNK